MRISNSKLKTWRRCPNQYRYKYVERLRTKKRSVALERGSWVHELLMMNYDGEDWRARHKELTRDFYNLFEEEREDLGDLPEECERLMKSYVAHYKREDKRWRVIDSEMDELIELPNGLQLQIIVDLIVEDTIDGGLWIWDHKTRKSFADADSMVLDPQLSLYFWGVQKMGYTPLRGAMYNEIRTKAPAIPQPLKRGGLSKAQGVDTTPQIYMQAIKDNGLDPVDYRDVLQRLVADKERFFRRTYLPKDKHMTRIMTQEAVYSAQAMQVAEREHKFPRAFDMDCKWKCDFKDICIAELHGADPTPLIKAGFERRT